MPELAHTRHHFLFVIQIGKPALKLFFKGRTTVLASASVLQALVPIVAGEESIRGARCFGRVNAALAPRLFGLFAKQVQFGILELIPGQHFFYFGVIGAFDPSNAVALIEYIKGGYHANLRGIKQQVGIFVFLEAAKKQRRWVISGNSFKFRFGCPCFGR